MYLFLVLALILLYYLWIQHKHYFLYWKISGAFGWPFLGVVLNIRNSERVFEYLKKLQIKFQSPTTLWMGPKCFLLVNDPTTMETIFTSPDCVNKSFIYKFLVPFGGDGLFTSNSPKWNIRRKLLKPTFNRNILSSFLPIFNATCEEFLDDLKLNASTKEYHLHSHLKQISLKIAIETTLGAKLKLDSKKLLQNYLYVIHAFMERLFKPWLHLHFIYKFTSKFRIGMTYAKEVNDMIDNMIIVRLREIKSNSTEALDTQHTMLDQLLTRKESNGLTNDDIRSEANVMVAAAFETTGTVLHICLTLLAMHPEVQDILYKELVNLFPDSDFTVNESDLKEMTYTEMTINESMRLLAPVPVIGRVTMKEIQLNNNIVVPKDTCIFLDIFNMQRSEKYWGPNAKKFDIEHFAPENLKNIHPFAFAPFALGNRKCIGFQYALNFLKIIIAKILRNYTISTNMTLEELKLVNGISLKFKEDPRFRFQPRVVT